MTTQTTQLINLSSANATKASDGYNSNLFFNFANILTTDPTIDKVTVSVLNAQIPCSFYNINVYNNVLKLSLNASAAVTITLTRGNYNANTLITELNSKINAAGISTITITISSVTGKLLFTVPTGYFTLFYATSTIFKVLGLIPTQNYISSSQSINADYPLNLLGILQIKVCSYTLQTNALDSSKNGSFNILTTIPIEAGNFGLVLYDNVTNIQYDLTIRTLSGFDIFLLDDQNNYVNLNGIDFTMTLLLTIFRSNKIVSSFSDIVGIPAVDTTDTTIDNTDTVNNTDNTDSVDNTDNTDNVDTTDNTDNIDINNVASNIDEPVNFDDMSDLDLLLYQHDGNLE